MPKVLVADDDSRMVRLLSMTLPSEYDVSQAMDGEEAIKVAEEMIPDLILLDVNMPGLNGFEVLRRVKQMPSLAHTQGGDGDGALRRGRPFPGEVSGSGRIPDQTFQPS